MSKSETVRWNGKIYRRWPNSKVRSDRCYFQRYSSGGKEYLHRSVWEEVFGQIPKGYEIHHIDGDTTNNSIENLECLNRADHRARHRGGTPAMIENMRKISILAKEWHKSEQGRAWHSEMAKNAWANRKSKECECHECGSVFSSKSARRPKFCSGKCKAANRRKSGVDLQERRCTICGSEYEVSKFSKGKTCSRTCRAVLAKRI